MTQTRSEVLLDVGAPSPPVAALDPLTVACPYKGFRYAVECRALPGQPCRGPDRTPVTWHHAERRVAAGEKLPSYEDRYGNDDHGCVDLGDEDAVELVEEHP